MTESPDEYGDILRRALRAEADEVVPSPDGLQIIRARIEERRARRHLLWWRAGASAVGAALVAAAIVIAVPWFSGDDTPRSREVAPVENATNAPEIAATSRPPAPATPSLSDAPVKVVPPPTPSGEKTQETAAPRTPSPTPTPTPTHPCPTPSDGSDQDGATPSGRPCPPRTSPATATPKPTPSGTVEPRPDTPCPVEECPTSGPSSAPSETPTSAPVVSTLGSITPN